jgi:hypothetical protein
LPAEGDRATLKNAEDVRKVIGISDDEMKEYDLKIEKKPDNSIAYNWNDKGKIEKEITLTKEQHEFIASILKKIDKNKKLSPQLCVLYDKFLA